jgi:hypothetical protein
MCCSSCGLLGAKLRQVIYIDVTGYVALMEPMKTYLSVSRRRNYRGPGTGDT